jgi:hypothetical protein
MPWTCNTIYYFILFSYVLLNCTFLLQEEDADDGDEIDPADVYTLDDFIVESEKYDSFRRKIGDKLKAKVEAASSPPSRCQR